MASATFENGQAVRAVGAAIRTGRAETRAAVRSAEPERVQQASGAARRRAPRIRVPAIWRGIGASVTIASGYVAFVAAIRWLLLLA
jgi:hypothetical protein